MGLPKKAKGGSKSKSKGGKEKDSRPEEPKKPQITVRKALQVDALCRVLVLASLHQTCTASRQVR